MSLWRTERFRLESRLPAPALAERLRAQAAHAGRLAAARGLDAAVTGGPGPLDEATERTPFDLTLMARGRLVEAARVRGEIAPGRAGARVEGELELVAEPGLLVATAGAAFLALGGLPVLFGGSTGTAATYLGVVLASALAVGARWRFLSREAERTRAFLRELLAAEERR